MSEFCFLVDRDYCFFNLMLILHGHICNSVDILGPNYLSVYRYINF